MLWRLLTGRLTKASLLTFIIILALRGAYLINKQDALDIRQGVASIFGTPPPTFALLDMMVIPAPDIVETPEAPLSPQAYETEVRRLALDFASASDSVYTTLQEIADTETMGAQQYNDATIKLAGVLNSVVGTSIKIRQMHPPEQHKDFHQRLLYFLEVTERANRSMIADYDNPGSISDEEIDELIQEMQQAKADLLIK